MPRTISSIAGSEEAPRTMSQESAPGTSSGHADNTAQPETGSVVAPLRELKADGLGMGGGKAVNLGILLRADLPVPDGFAVTTAAYGMVSSTDGMASVIARLAEVAPSDTARLAELAGEARGLILASPIPAEIAEAVCAAYRALGPGGGLGDGSANSTVGTGGADGADRGAAGARVAVRSSATAEDLPSASFAGQQDTYLNVVGEEALLDAVRRCWASLWTDRAVAYRSANTIDQGAVQLAVVVQRMVQSSAAGVLFTANPLTGQRRQMVVDASPGLGEAVVSGAVNPDHWVLDGRTGRAVETRLGDKRLVIRGVEGGGTEHVTLEDGSASACLTDAQLRNLVALGQRVQTLFGAPQDIELAFDEAGACWLVQARPITTLYPLPSEGRGTRGEGRGGAGRAAQAEDDLRVYFSVNVAQGVFRPITPMGIQTWRLLAGSLATVFGRPPSDHYAGVATVVEAGERVFLDVTPVLRHKLGRRIFVNATRFMEARSQAMAQALTADPHFAAEGSALPLVRRIVRTAVRQGVPGGVFRALTRPAAARTRALRFAQRVVQLAEVGPTATPEQRLDTVDRAFTLGAARLWFDILPVAAVGLLSRVVAGKLLGELATSEEVERVVRALPHNPTTEMDLALWALAERLRVDAASAKAFAERSAAELSGEYQEGSLPPVLQRELARFLAAWGARGVAEIDLGLPRWSEDPTHILGVLANYLRLEDRSRAPDAQFAEAAAEAERTITELGTRAGGLKGWLVTMLLHRTRELAGLREWPKYYFVVASAKARESLKVVGAALVEQGRLEAGDDIFFVTLPEARAGLAGTDLRDLVAERRERYANELGRRHVPRMLLSDGTEPTPAPVDGEELEDGALRGTPASSGVVRGTARVILDPVGAHLEPGEILVAPSTDPGWTPLFLTAAGLVMEMGGAMSHGSVVAREYGIPAVVGVDGASSKIETGQTIEVDGGRGIVRVVSE